MTQTEFIKVITDNNISANLIHFQNTAEDGYYVLKNYHRWEVFFRERGKDYDCVGFPSESNALIYLSERLICK